MTRDDGMLFLARALSPEQSVGRTAGLRHDLARHALGWEGVVELASRHLVTPALYPAFATRGLLTDLPADVRSYLEAVHQLNGERNRRIAGQVLETLTALNGAGIAAVLLKGVAHRLGGLYGDPAARVIGDIDLLVAKDELAGALRALAALGYREVDLGDGSLAEHHHHTPLARPDDVALVELHTEPLFLTFSSLLPAAQVFGRATSLVLEGQPLRLPSVEDQILHNIAHTQLSDRNHWSGRVSLRHLSDLAWLRARHGAAIDWRGIVARFDRAGHGSACRAYLLTAERLLGQPLPAGVERTPGASLAAWRIAIQSRHPWLMAAGKGYGYHRAMLADLRTGSTARRRLLTRLRHPDGYRRYLRTLRAHLGRTH